jgi:hypothetical protein
MQEFKELITFGGVKLVNYVMLVKNIRFLKTTVFSLPYAPLVLAFRRLKSTAYIRSIAFFESEWISISFARFFFLFLTLYVSLCLWLR